MLFNPASQTGVTNNSVIYSRLRFNWTEMGTHGMRWTYVHFSG